MTARKHARLDVPVIENPHIRPPEHRLHVREILAGESEARPFHGEVRQQRIDRQRARQEWEEKIVEPIPFMADVEAANE